MTDEQFLHGVAEAKKVCRYMPTPADIIRAHNDAPAKRCELAALPAYDSSPESWERQRRMAGLCRLSLEGDMQAKKFFERSKS